MTDLRKAAEQALEALENIGRWLPTIGQKGLRDYEADAIQALRQALAESANSATDFVEPKASSQPEHEPVAWMHNFIEGTVITHEPADIDRHPDRWTPLYTAPPKREWVGLTEDEVTDCFLDSSEKGILIEEAIEAKLKEKST